MSAPIHSVDLAKAYRLLNHGPTVLVSARHQAVDNVMAAAWCCALDFDPPKLTVVIDKATRTRALRSITTAPRGFEGEGFPVRRAFHGVDLAGRGEVDLGLHLAGSGVEHPAGTAGLAGHDLPVDPVTDALHGQGSSQTRYCDRPRLRYRPWPARPWKASASITTEPRDSTVSTLPSTTKPS